MAKQTATRSRTFWWFLAGPVVVLLSATLWAWPYLAITETTGSKVLVVEGWMDPTAMREAAQLIADSGYTHVYTTGTARPFSYLLDGDKGLSIDLHMALGGTLALEATGLPGSGFSLTSGKDTLLHEHITADMFVYSTEIAPVDHLQLTVWGGTDPGITPQIFVRSLKIQGMNVNMLQRRSWFTRPGDASEPAWPTYAQSARSELIGLGVPAERIMAVPAYGRPRSRSWGNAHAFSIQARIDEITAFDVATLGVHARRSHKLFQTAADAGVQVGVIALTDPFCTQENWWKSWRGWLTVLKEVLGTPEAEVVELKRRGQGAGKNTGP